MGVILGSAVYPIAICVTWRKANKWACVGGAITGFACGLIAWLVTTSTLNDNVINVTVSALYILNYTIILMSHLDKRRYECQNFSHE